MFGKNLKQLLMQPPVAGLAGCWAGIRHSVPAASWLSWMPTGKVLDTTVIFPTAPPEKVEESKKIVKNLIKKYNIS